MDTVKAIVVVNITRALTEVYEKHTGAFEYTIIYNNELKKVSDQPKVFLIDSFRLFDGNSLESFVCSDGIHPSKEGNRILAEEIGKLITTREMVQRVSSSKNREELQEALSALNDLFPVDVRFLGLIYERLKEFNLQDELCNVFEKNRDNPLNVFETVRNAAAKVQRVPLYNKLALLTRNQPTVSHNERRFILALPSTYVFELTNACNLKCPMCGHSYMHDRKQGFMSDEVFFRALNQIKNRAKEARLYSTGESLLHPRLLDFIKLIQSEGIRVLLSTNATLLDDDFLQKMAFENAIPEYMQISIEGWDKNSYEFFRRGAKYERLVENLILLKQYRDGLHWNMKIICHSLVTKSTDSKAFIEQWKNYFDEIKFNVMMPPRFFTELAPAELMQEIFLPTNKQNPGVCTLPFSEVSIGWDGKISACCGDFDFRLDMGDIMMEDLADIWNGETYSTLRYDLWSGRFKESLCHECDYPYYMGNDEVNKFLESKLRG